MRDAFAVALLVALVVFAVLVALEGCTYKVDAEDAVREMNVDLVYSPCVDSSAD